MRKLVVAAMLALAVGVSGQALAAPSGSTEGGNQAACQKPSNGVAGAHQGGVLVGPTAGGNFVYAGPTGADTCSDDSIPLDGRIVVSAAGPYVATDGDNDNAAAGNTTLTGCLKIVPGSTTVSCTGGNSDN